jgi:cation diffusion facilitator CzcD-associated flavoprotein CzcO
MGDRSMQGKEILVIGAGASGLAAAYALRELGKPVRVIDKGSRAGEAWYHRHPQLHLNTHRLLSRLPGMTIPEWCGAFPSRDSIIWYLDEYARKLDAPIDYGVNVQQIKHTDIGWEVVTDAGTYNTTDVILATGHDQLPYIPDWEGRSAFTKPLIHAADFGDVENYRNKRVLVVGAGNSGTDILNHLAGIDTEQLWVSVRHGPAIFPKRLWGIPLQPLAAVFARLPVRLVDKLLKLTEYLAFGNLRKWGLPSHPQGGASRLLKSGIAPAIDNGFVAALKAGRIEVVSSIRNFDSEGAHLSDGRYIKPDIVIAATGYRMDLKSILGPIGVLTDSGSPRFHGVQQHSAYLGLWFIGMEAALPGYFYMASKDGREIARAIKLKQTPDRLHTDEIRVLTEPAS